MIQFLRDNPLLLLFVVAAIGKIVLAQLLLAVLP
jgi:hypothetical protein